MATGRVPTTANSPLTAKGDLFTYSTAPARLAVGNNGEQIVADSSTSTGLRYTGNYAAGKNAVINGDFFVNQRSFTSTTTSGVYMFDRWNNYLSDGTVTYSAQTFTPGSAPVAGYESANFIRCVTSGQTAAGAAAQLSQPIENVRTFAGQTVTVSFWAKAATGTPKIGLELSQTFGSGGSATVFSALGAVTISTSWVRYSVTYAVPSISGKTIGTSSFLGTNFWTSAGTSFATRASSIGIQSATIDIWGVQVEAGSVATAFQTATGTIQGELAACQRYLPAIFPANNGELFSGLAYSTTKALIPVVFPVTARVQPTGVTVSAAGNFSVRSAAAAQLTCTALVFSTGTYFGCTVEATVASGLVAGNATNLFNGGSGNLLFTGCEL